MDERPNRELELEVTLAALRSHERHMSYIYGLRWGGLGLSFLTILIGAIMVFRGLEGSFNWAVEAPYSIGAKLTNASPGIVFATVGTILGFLVILQKPVNYDTGGQGTMLYRLNSRGVTLTAAEIVRAKKRTSTQQDSSGISLGPS